MSAAAKPTGPASPEVEARARYAQALLDAVAAATFLLTPQGRILHTNRAADALLRDADGLRTEGGYLVAARASRQAALQEIIFAAGHLDARDGAIALPRPSGERPLQALVAPLAVGDGDTVVPHVLILVTDPAIAARFSDTVLAALYSFTPAEAEVANALLAGNSQQEIAAFREVSPGTTRLQIKSLLRKTDSRRQADLVRLLMTAPRAACAKSRRHNPMGR